MKCLSDLGEFDLIARIRRLAEGQAENQIILGMGDDAAIVRPRSGEDLVVSSDALVEEVHFRWQTQSPVAIGRRALAVNLSDLAAMGARPLGCTLALAAPPALPLARFDGLLRGLLREGQRAGCPLIGGNLSRAREVSLALTVLGAVKAGRALKRDALRKGDRLLVTGTLGGAALALARAERGGGRLRRVPEARLAVGRALARLPGRGACIDISDGLLADLSHLLECSDLGAELDLAALPRERGYERACRDLGLDAQALQLCGGEDYELLFSLRPDAPSARVLSRRAGLLVTEIGSICGQPGIRTVPPLTPKRRALLAAREGWRHF